MAREGSPWLEVTFDYPPELRIEYREGNVFKGWYSKYQKRFLYDDKMLRSRQIPHSGPLSPGQGALGFGELFVGNLYLDAGYEVMWRYLPKENRRSYEKVCELLGSEAGGQFLAPDSEVGGRAPDLLVFDPESGRFRFVECKAKNERFAHKQVERFAGIEAFLNSPVTKHGAFLSVAGDDQLFPVLPVGQWIHIACVVPAKSGS